MAVPVLRPLGSEGEKTNYALKMGETTSRTPPPPVAK